MTKIIISTILTLSSSLLYADNLSYTFVGAQTTIDRFSGTTAPSFGIKYGKQADMWRSALSLSYAKNASDSLTSLLLDVNRGVLEKVFKDFQTKPYVGVSMGMMQHKKKKSNSGYAYGLNGGFTYLFDDNIDIDIGLHYMSASKIETMNNLTDVTFSVHYFY